MPEPHLRASDADRAAVADVLGAHMSAGRLTVAEYDERLTRAYAARTYGELDELTTDLPVPAASAAGATGTSAAATAGTSSSGAHPSRPASGPVWGHLWAPGMCGSRMGGTSRAVWGQWLTTAVIVTTIWLVSSLGSGEWSYPWPIWVIGPWGAVLLAETMSGRGRDHPQAHDSARLGAGTTSGTASLSGAHHRSPERAPH